MNWYTRYLERRERELDAQLQSYRKILDEWSAGRDARTIRRLENIKALRKERKDLDSQP